MLSSTLRSLTRLAGLTFAASLLASPAAGTTFEFDWATGSPDLFRFKSKAGVVESLFVSFNDVTEVFTFTSVFSPVGNNRVPDGGWLVISDGPNPQGVPDEWAIYYMDRVTGNLTAYVYDGTSGAGSFQQTPFVESFPLAVNAMIGGDGNLTMGFSVDVSVINAANIGPQWKGTEFFDEVGIWFHPSAPIEAIYDDNGQLLSWQTTNNGFFDGKNPFATRQVPEPAASLLVGLVGVALVAAGRRASLRR